MRTKRSMLVLRAAGLLLAVAGCSAGGGVFWVDGRQSSRSIHMHMGDQIIVHLGYGPDASFAWYLDLSDPSLFDAADPALIPNYSPTGGSTGGVEVWAFEAKTPGTATFHWEYRQGGMVDAGPAVRSVDLDVLVLDY